MINELSPKQEKELIPFREKWLQIGLSCEPANKELAEQELTKVYSEYFSLKKPYFWWVDSPAMGMIVINILKQFIFKDLDKNKLGNNLWDNLGDKLSNRLWGKFRGKVSDKVSDNLWDNLRGNLMGNLWDNLRGNLAVNLKDNLKDNLMVNLKNNLKDNLRNNLRNKLMGNLWDNPRDNLMNNLKDNLRGNLAVNLMNNLRGNDLFENTYFWGQQDVYWISFYLFAKQFLGIKYGEYEKGLDMFANIGKSCNWIWFYKDICFVSDRAEYIHRKDNNLHNEDGPAIRFRDGYSLYALNGVRVEKEIVETPPEKLDPALLITEQNAEVRREIIRKIGVSRIIQKLKAEQLDTWREYVLYSINNIDIEPVRILRMNCPSTDMIYALRVPPEINKAYDAIKWCNKGVEPEKLLIET